MTASQRQVVYEYALDPALLDNWKDFRYFVEKFGFHKGRLISDFPKRWRREVNRLVCERLAREDKGDVKYTKIVEMLGGLDCLLQRGRPWQPEKDWLTNAETQHEIRPFRAVVSKQNPRQKDFVLSGDDVTEDDPLFAAQTTFTVQRSAQAMADLVSPMLRWAKEMGIISNSHI